MPSTIPSTEFLTLHEAAARLETTRRVLLGKAVQKELRKRDLILEVARSRGGRRQGVLRWLVPAGNLEQIREVLQTAPTRRRKKPAADPPSDLSQQLSAIQAQVLQQGEILGRLLKELGVEAKVS